MSGANSNDQTQTTQSTVHPNSARKWDASNIQMTQNSLLIWSDSNTDQSINADQNTNTHLRDAVNNIKTLINDERCIQFSQEMGDKKACLIISGSIGQQIVPDLKSLPQIDSIFIFCSNEGYPAKWIKDWSKIMGVFSGNGYRSGTLKQNAVPITTMDGGDASFTCTQIINSEQQHNPLWCDKRGGLLHGMLDLMKKLGFFTEDLHYHTEERHQEQFTICCEQAVQKEPIDETTLHSGGPISLNNFLFAGKDRSTSLDFVRRAVNDAQMVDGLFAMVIDPTRFSTSFTPILDLEYFRGGGGVKEDNQSRLAQAQIILDSNNDAETMPDAMSYISTGEMYSQMGDYAKALLYYETALAIQQQSSSPIPTLLATTYNYMGSAYGMIGDYLKALPFHQSALAIRLQSLPPTHPDLGASYNNIGVVYRNMGDSLKALSSFGKAILIYRQSLRPIHPALAMAFDNLGSAFYSKGDYSKALLVYQKTLTIRQRLLPLVHPDIASSYNNIGLIYSSMGDYAKALWYYEKNLAIQQQLSPPNYTAIAMSYNNIGSAYSNMGDYPRALSNLQKELEINQQLPSPDYLALARSYNNIGVLYRSMGDSPQALSSFVKAISIYRQLLLPSHPGLATAFDNLGSVFYSKGDYPKALLVYQKTLAIQQRLLPPTHPNLAFCYANIGLVYVNMNDYSKAFSSYEKALFIRKQIFPPAHADLAATYSDMGSLHAKMDNYWKAQLYYELAVDLGQRSLTANDLQLQKWRYELSRLKRKL